MELPRFISCPENILSHPHLLGKCQEHHISLINSWWWHKKMNASCRQRIVTSVGWYRDAQDTIIAHSIRKDSNKYIINASTRQTVMNATIKTDIHSKFSTAILISNNLSHCSYKYTSSHQSMCPDFRVQQMQSLLSQLKYKQFLWGNGRQKDESEEDFIRGSTICVICIGL